LLHGCFRSVGGIELKMSGLFAWRTAILVALAAFVVAQRPASGADPVDLPAILSLSGPAAFIGGEQQKTLAAIEREVNAHGGIRGRQIHFVVQDDQSSPAIGVQLVNALAAKKVPAIFGPTTSGVCSAVYPIVRDNGPVIYCYAPGIHPAPGSYAFSATVGSRDVATVIARWVRLKGWTKVAIISSTDASGQDFERGFDAALAEPDNATLKLVAREHFAVSDLTVAAQLARIKTAQPQVLIAWTAGTGFGTVMHAVKDAGLNVPIVGGNGNMIPQQLAQYADFLPADVYFPGGRGMSAEGTGAGPVRDKQTAYFNAMKAAGIKVSFPNFAAWDATYLMLDAYSDLGFDITAQQMRDSIRGRHGWVGMNGIYDFRDAEQRGVGPMNAVIDRYDAARGVFIPASRPGGYLSS
jgi:branched-chain amino acid transport system substrate-binding protein